MWLPLLLQPFRSIWSKWRELWCSHFLRPLQSRWINDFWWLLMIFWWFFDNYWWLLMIDGYWSSIIYWWCLMIIIDGYWWLIHRLVMFQPDHLSVRQWLVELFCEERAQSHVKLHYSRTQPSSLIPHPSFAFQLDLHYIPFPFPFPFQPYFNHISTPISTGRWFRTCFIFPYIGNLIIPIDEL